MSNATIVKLILSQPTRAGSHKSKYVDLCQQAMRSQFRKFPTLELFSEAKKKSPKAASKYELDLLLVQATISDEKIVMSIKATVTKGGQMLHREIAPVQKNVNMSGITLGDAVDALVNEIAKQLLPKIVAHSKKR